LPAHAAKLDGISRQLTPLRALKFAELALNFKAQDLNFSGEFAHKVSNRFIEQRAS